MVSKEEYSLLAAAAYNDARGEDNRLDVTPLGWVLFDSRSDTSSNPLLSGLSVNAYSRGNDIVIACKGTDFLTKTNMGQTISDLGADVALGLGMNISSQQLFEAALFYQNIKRDYPDANITFTGHSLGAGLASILSVWFGKEATVFADAPFELTAKNPVVMAKTAAYLALHGHVDGAFATFMATYLVNYSAREALVTNYYVEGEVLNDLFTNRLPFVVGTNNMIDVGTNTLASDTLHSIVLHSAMLNSTPLRLATISLPTLLDRMFDSKLYAFDLYTEKGDFLTKLLKSHIPAMGDAGAHSLLTHFGLDMGKLGTNVGGLTTAAQNAIIAQGMEWYYWQGQDYAGQELFTTDGFVLQYAIPDVDSSGHSMNKASLYVSGWLDPLVALDGGRPTTYKFEQWNVVTNAMGAAAGAQADAKTQIFVGAEGVDTLTGGSKDDMLLGADGNDFLNGGAGSDHLFGGSGDDTINGGAGDDWLFGGIGSDTYKVDSGQAGDVIQDTDGMGIVTVDGTQLTGGKKTGDNAWISDDKKWKYILTGSGDLIITSDTGVDKIVIRGWQASGGDRLGIELEDEEAPDDTPPPVNIINGDIIAISVENTGGPIVRYRADGSTYVVVESGAQRFVRDGLGNLVQGSGFTVVNNTLFGSDGRDIINGMVGNDLLGGKGGNDEVNGGVGDDMIGGGDGDDVINGGDGNDYISSAGGIMSDRQQYGPNDIWGDWGRPVGVELLASGSMWGAYPGEEVTIWNGITETSTADQNDTIDAGAGDDWVMASWGDDQVDGGAGKDNIDGLAGDDLLEGGDGDDRIDGDGIVKVGYLNTVGAANHGNDYADGGAGKDVISGDGGNDDLFGGADDDQIFGDVGVATDSEYFVPFEFHGMDYLDGEEGADYLEGGAKDDTLYGGDGNDNMWGDQSATRLVGDQATNMAAWGDDYLDGEDGNDQLVGGGKDDTLFGGIGNDALWGDQSNIALDGAANGEDYLDGEEGDDVLVGGGRDDLLFGDVGNDSLYGDDTEENLAIAHHGSDYLDGGEGNDYLDGGGGDDVLVGGDGDDTLIGGAGADYLEGGAGNDSYGIDSEDDIIVEADDPPPPDPSSQSMMMSAAGVTATAAPAIDTVRAAIDYSLGRNIEHLVLTGEGNISGTGNTQHNALFGNSGNNVLTGWVGNDYNVGGAGDDTYVFRRGDGQDTISNLDFLSDAARPERVQAFDTLRFDGIAATDVIGTRTGDSLLLRIRNSEEYVVVSNYFAADVTVGDITSDHRIDRVEFAGGVSWDQTQIQAAVDRAANNQGPVVSGQVPPVQARAGVQFSYTVPAGVITDPDPDDAITYRVEMVDGSPVPAWLSFDGETGTFAGTPDEGSVGQLQFWLWGTDNYGAATATLVQMQVAEPNHAPTVAAPLQDQQVIEGRGFSYVVPAGAFVDVDAADTLTFSATLADGSALPSWLVFDAQTRTFSGTAEGAGTLSVRVTASDGSLTASDVFDLAVQPNLAPVLSVPLYDHEAPRGQAFVYTVPANAFTDGEGDLLAYSATLADGSALPAWLSFDAQTRTFSGMPQGTGTISVRVVASDGRSAASDVFDITIPPGDAPVLTLPLQDQQTIQGQPFSYAVPAGTFVDPDADALTYTAVLANGSDLPSWLVFDALALTFSGVAEGTGTISVRVIARDGANLSASDVFELTVQSPPVYGTEGDDVLQGATGADVLHGLGGADTLLGGAGNDELHGGDGSDSLYGEAGDDVLYGGGSYDNVLDGGDGHDRIYGHATVYAGAGNDMLDASGTLYLGRGNDTVVLREGRSSASIYDTPLAGELKTLHFAGDLGPEDVAIWRNGNDLWLGWGAPNPLPGQYLPYHGIVYGFFTVPASAGKYQVTFESDPGTVWSHAILLEKLNTPTQGSDTIEGTAGNDVIDALGGTDTVRGNGGDDVLLGGAGDDSLYGGNGNDTLNGGDQWDTLEGEAGDDVLSHGYYMRGGTGRDTYRIFEGPNHTNGASITAGNDLGDTVIVGGGFGSADVLVQRNLAGSEFLLINRITGEKVYLNGFVTAAGTPARYAEVRFDSEPGTVWTTAQLIALAMTGGSGNDRIWGLTDVSNQMSGGAGDDQLYGGQLADILDGGTGNDVLSGGLGNDVYLFGAASGVDQVTDTSGTNTVRLAAGVTVSDVLLVRTGQTASGAMHADDSLIVIIQSTGARLTYDQFFRAGGTGSIEFTDGSGTVWSYADITTLAGASVTGAADTFTGTSGNDLFNVDNASDAVVEAVDGGIDTVRSTVSYTLGENVENLELVGPYAFNGTGNAANNVLWGNAANNVLRGAGGYDTYHGGAGDDVYYHSSIRFNSAYQLFNAPVPDIHENAGEGYDTIVTDAFSMTMADNVERLLVPTLMDIWSFSYYPNDVREYRYYGNGLDNVIDLRGPDFTEFSGVPVRIDGGAGADVMIGGTGYLVTYGVDNAGDVIQHTGGGIAAVESSITYTLAGNMTNLKLTGSDAIEGYGNARNNVLRADANTGANRLEGFGGDDTYHIDFGDTVVEAANSGIDKVVLESWGSTAPVAEIHLDIWGSVESVELGANLGHVNLIGNAQANTLYGSLGFNTIQGMGGDDILSNLNPAHVPYNSFYGYYPWPGGIDHLDGGDGNDTIYSYGASDVILGGDGNDTVYIRDASFAKVDGGAGNDTVTLDFTGSNPASYSGGGVSMLFGAGSGNDVLRNYKPRTPEQWAMDRSIRGEVKLAEGTDATALRFTRDGADLVVGLQGHPDTLRILQFFEDAESGAIVSSVDAIRLNDGTMMTRDAIFAALGSTNLEVATGGDDVLVASLAGGTVVGLAGNDLLIGQAGGDELHGKDGNDTLFGGGGADTLVGGEGDDRLVGGHGADTYLFSATWGADIIDDSNRAESHYSGGALVDDGAVDTVTFDASIAVADVAIGKVDDDLVLTHGPSGSTLRIAGFFGWQGSAVERFVFADGTEWSIADIHTALSTTTGTEGNDVLSAWQDGGTVHGLGGDDEIHGSWNNDFLYGGDGIDTLYGNDGYDLLDGGAGADAMYGGWGDDTYVVDDTGDVVTEDQDGGWDMVQSSVTATLGAYVENLHLVGSGHIDGTGNGIANELFGNDGNNRLNGLGGADSLYGGLGNDTYVLGTGDQAYEDENAGIDTVESSATHTLAEHMENLTLTGTSTIHGTGNALDNVLSGSGNTRANTLTGGAGNDTYIVGSGDNPVEAAGGGTDTVHANLSWTLQNEVENLLLLGSGTITGTGNTLANVITGNSGNNTLTGLAGNDTLNGAGGTDTIVGGAGKDTLTGGAGVDTFDFNALSESGVGAANRDLILDFLQGTDKIDLATIDARTTTSGDQAFSFIGTGAFTAAGQLRYTTSGGNTIIQGNVDASLGADFEIELVGTVALVATNFVL